MMIIKCIVDDNVDVLIIIIRKKDINMMPSAQILHIGLTTQKI